MIPRLLPILTAVAVACCSASAADVTRAPDLRLWYTRPASTWTEALPVGNGHMGAMVFGGINRERIQFNEDTLWKGKPHDYVRAGALEQLAEIRRLVFEGKADEAGKLARAKAISDPVRQMPYQPFGDLRFEFPGHQSATNYRRALDLASALATTSYEVDGVRFEREVFASYPDRALVVRLTASQPGQLQFTLAIDSPHTNARTTALRSDTLALSGQLPPNKVGRHGQLQEWQEDWDAPNNKHWHMSPLFALYPGWEITPADARIYQGARKLLEWRGDGSTGWSYAWRMPLWARVGDGDVAFKQFEGLLQRRTLPNLFDLCGPFQIDGNFGACAGLAEMLLQSHRTSAGDSRSRARVIHLLPALPTAWKNGSVRGLRARDGFEVDLCWEGGRLQKVQLRSDLGRPFKVHYAGREVPGALKKGRQLVLGPDLELKEPERL